MVTRRPDGFVLPCIPSRALGADHDLATFHVDYEMPPYKGTDHRRLDLNDL